MEDWKGRDPVSPFGNGDDGMSDELNLEVRTEKEKDAANSNFDLFGFSSQVAHKAFSPALSSYLLCVCVRMGMAYRGRGLQMI